MTVWSPAPGWPSRSFSRLTGSHVCLPHSSCVGPGTSFKPPQCLEMLMGCNAIKHFWVQITGQAILVRSHSAIVIAYVNHQVAPSRTRGHQGTALLAVFTPRRENVAAVALSRDWIVPTEFSPAPEWPSHFFSCSFSQSTGSHVCLSHSRGVGPGTPFNPPQCLGMLTGRNVLQQFRAQITGQAILVRADNAMVGVCQPPGVIR